MAVAEEVDNAKVLAHQPGAKLHFNDIKACLHSVAS